MSISLGDKLSRRYLAGLDRVLQRRWVQICLFLGTFLLFWLLGTKTAHAGPWPGL